jgi:bla regulator protein blaR1
MLSHILRASLEGAVLAAAVWLACRALPRMSPGVRTLLWWCVAAKFVVALVWLTPIGVPVLPRAAVDASSSAPSASPVIAPAIPPRTVGGGLFDAAPVTESGAPAIPWTALLVGAWALGVGASLLRTAQGWRRTRGVVARSVPADEGLHAMARELSGRMGRRWTVDVRASAEVESPLIVGVRRPVILVPARGFAALAPDQQRLALCHELAHLRRGDLWLGCIPAAAERCFFFHPLARLAAREYAFWREAACDEAVLTTLGASPQSYGRMLLALGVSRRTAAFSAAGAAWSFQNLKRRITMLDRTSPSSLRGRAIAAGAVAAALLAIAPVKAVARAASPETPTAAPIAVPAPRTAPAAVPATAAAARTVTPAVPETVARAEDVEFILFSEDGTVSMAGSTENRERAERHRRPGEPMLWFRHEGREYVVRDRAVLREVEALWDPVSRIGAEQGRIGEQMGEIGEAQGHVGAQQGEIGARQGELGGRMGEIGARIAALSTRSIGNRSDSERRAIERELAQLEEESSRLGEQMDALSQEMEALDVPMHSRDGEMEALGAEMEVLNGRMETAMERANREMEPLMRRAIGSGAAVSVG